MKYDWFLVQEEEDENTGESYQIDYSKVLRKYRISFFKNNHFQDEIIFDEVKNEKLS